MVKTIHINWKKDGIIAITTRRLSEAQHRAYCKLTDKWQNAGVDLRERTSVLDGLVQMKLAEKRFVYGNPMAHDTNFDYRKTELINDDKSGATLTPSPEKARETE